MAEKFDYIDMQSVAAELIEEFGQPGQLIRMTLPDPDYGGTPTPTPYDVTLVPVQFEARYVNGSTILNTDTLIYISSKGIAIKPVSTDKVVVGGVRYSIVGNDPNNYDGITDVVYIVHGRIAD